MPLRLTANESNLSGHAYADVLGVRYEFPRQYRNLVSTGERFVYYRGRRRADGGTQPQVYLGTGIVGAVAPSPVRPDYLVCAVERWEPFAEPLPFKNADGTYFEPGATQGGYYLQAGVRRIGEDVYERIVQAGTGTVPASEERSANNRVLVTAYASPALVRAVDDYAVAVADEEVRRLWPGRPVEILPRNNPGFDIRVGPADAHNASSR